MRTKLRILVKTISVPEGSRRNPDKQREAEAADWRTVPKVCLSLGDGDALRGHPKPANEGHLKTGQR
jgi:hypothetical protein